MRLSECLNAADISTLRKISENYQLPGPRYSKLSLMEEILLAFRTPSFLEVHIDAWHTARPSTMLRLCLESRENYAEEELEAMLLQGGKSTETMATVGKEGWLFPAGRLHGRTMYTIPTELKQRILQHIVNQVQSSITQSSDGPLTYQEEDCALSRDLGAFLEYVRHHDVQITVEGTMYKRNLQQVLELLEISEELLQGGWRFGYGRRFHDYPDRLALLYDYAYHQQLIVEGEDGRLCVTEAAMTWSAMERLNRQQSLVRYYVSLYRRPIPRLPQIVQLLSRIATSWLSSEDVKRVLSPLINTYYYDDVQQIWDIRIVKMLMHLGVLRVGQNETKTTWFQITKLGQQLITQDNIVGTEERELQRILIVQPNFEIIVTADEPLITAELALFTELRETGAIRLYRLTDESVTRGLTTKRPMDDWIAFVQKHSQSPMPGNVERTLKEWARAFSGDGHSMTS